MIRLKLSENTYLPKIKTRYPYLLIDTLDKSVAVLLSKMPDGKLPINIYHANALKTIAQVSYNPKHIKLLIQLQSPVIVYSKTERCKITSLQEFIKNGSKLVTLIEKGGF